MSPVTPRPRSTGDRDARGADLFDRDRASERRIGLVPFQYHSGSRRCPSRERVDRSGADAVDADLLRAEIVGEVARAGFERGLGHAHDVVMRHHLFRAVISEGEERCRPAASEARRAWRARSRSSRKNEQAFWTKRPRWCRHGALELLLSANATAWTRKSSEPHSSASVSNTPATVASSVTSQGSAARSRPLAPGARPAS